MTEAGKSELPALPAVTEDRDKKDPVRSMAKVILDGMPVPVPPAKNLGEGRAFRRRIRLEDHGRHEVPTSQAVVQVFRELVQLLPDARASFRRLQGRNAETAGMLEDLVLYKVHRLQTHLHVLCVTSKKACDLIRPLVQALKHQEVEALLTILDSVNDYILSDFIRLLAYTSNTPTHKHPKALPDGLFGARPKTVGELGDSDARDSLGASGGAVRPATTTGAEGGGKALIARGELGGPSGPPDRKLGSDPSGLRQPSLSRSSSNLRGAVEATRPARALVQGLVQSPRRAVGGAGRGADEGGFSFNQKKRGRQSEFVEEVSDLRRLQLGVQVGAGGGPQAAPRARRPTQSATGRAPKLPIVPTPNSIAKRIQNLEIEMQSSFYGLVKAS